MAVERMLWPLCPTKCFIDKVEKVSMVTAVLVVMRLFAHRFFTQPGQCYSCGAGMAFDSDSIALQYSTNTNFIVS